MEITIMDWAYLVLTCLLVVQRRASKVAGIGFCHILKSRIVMKQNTLSSIFIHIPERPKK